MKFGYAGASFALLFVIISGFVLDEAYAQASNFRVTNVDSVFVSLEWDNLDDYGARYYNVELNGYLGILPTSVQYNVTTYHRHEEGETVNYTLTVYGPSWSILTETTITVTIPANVPPTADAGRDKTVGSGGSFTLDGAGSTDDNKDLLEYRWIQTAGPDARFYYINDVARLEVTVPDVYETTTLTFKLTVWDYSGDSDDDFVNVTIIPAYNAPPDADAGDNRTVAPGDRVILNAINSYDDNTPMQDLNYSWQQIMGTNVMLSDAQSMRTSFTVPDIIVSTETLRFKLTVTDRLGKNGSDSVDLIVVPPANNAPTADAGDHQAVKPGDPVTLNGSRSSDPDQSDPLDYSWYQTGGTPVTLSNYTAITPNFTAPTGNPTLLVFELTVTDSRGDAGTDEVQVTVATHDSPVANAGPDRAVSYDDRVTLNASRTEYSHTTTLTYTWTKTEGPSDAPDSLSGETANFTVPTLGPDAEQPTDLVYKLTVSDGVYTDHDFIKFSIFPGSDPVAVGYADPNDVRSGQTVTLNGDRSFDYENPITGSWETVSEVAVNLQGSELTNNFIAPYVTKDTTIEFVLTVFDNSGHSDNDTVNVTIRPNRRPTANAGADQIVRAGTTYVGIHGSGDDPENDALHYSWEQVSGETVTILRNFGDTIRFNAPNTFSVLVFELTVSDGAYEATDRVTITVKTNDYAPTANAGPDMSAIRGDTVTLSGSGHDGDGHNIIYSWTQTGGTRVTLRDSDTQNPSFIAPRVQTETTLTFELTVADYSRNGTDTVNVTILPSANALSANAGENQSRRSGERIDLNGTAILPGGDDAKYEWKKLSGPESIKIVNSNQADAYFTAPAVINEAEVVFRFKVTVGEFYSADNVTIMIRPNERHDINAGEGWQRVNTGDTVTLDGTVTNPDNDQLTYEWRLIYASGYELSQAQEESLVNAVDRNSEDVSFIAPILPDGERVLLIFLYTVSDGLYRDHDIAYVHIS